MGWKVIDGPRAVKLTRRLAEMFAQMDRYPNDREIQSSRLESIKRAITEGRFRAPEWATAKCLETGKTYRVNGKHTSTVLAASEAVPDVKVIITDYECRSMMDVASLYATFDAKFSARSSKDIYMAYAATVPELAEISSKIINLAAPGIAYALWEDQSTLRHTSEERAENLLRHPAFVIWLNDMQPKSKDHRFLFRGPVVAAMFKTYCKDKKRSDEFWHEVRDGTNTDPKAATRTLQRWLMTASLSRKGSNHEEKHKATDHEMLCRCLHAWNAWRRSEPTKLQYYTDKPTPDVA